VTRGEARRLAGHAVHRISTVGAGIVAGPADRVAGRAQLEGLGLIQGSDSDRGRAVLLQELARRCVPKRVTAAMWLAMAGGIGAGTDPADTPVGTVAEVT